MRNGFTIENSLEKEVVLTIRVPKNFDEDMEHRMNEAFCNVLFDMGYELVNSEPYCDSSTPDIQHVDLNILKFRDYDDTDIPLQFFYGLEMPRDQVQALASYWGYKGALCKDIAICLDIYSLEECPVEAVLTFEDDDQRWVDLRSNVNHLDKLISIAEHAGSERAREALELFKEYRPSLEAQLKTASDRVAEPQSSYSEEIKKSEPEL